MEFFTQNFGLSPKDEALTPPSFLPLAETLTPSSFLPFPTVLNESNVLQYLLYLKEKTVPTVELYNEVAQIVSEEMKKSMTFFTHSVRNLTFKLPRSLYAMTMFGYGEQSYHER